MQSIWYLAIVIASLIAGSAHAQTYLGDGSSTTGYAGTCCNWVAVTDATSCPPDQSAAHPTCQVITSAQYNAYQAAQQNKYQVQFQIWLNKGISLTSSGTPALNGVYPIDNNTLNYLTSVQTLVKNTVIITGNIAGTGLTVVSVQPDTGQIVNKSAITGTGILPGTMINNFISGTGDVGTYRVQPSQTVSTTEFMMVGSKGSGFPDGGSTIGLADITGTYHTFSPVDFLNFAQAVIRYRNLLTQRAVNANGWPSSNQVTIP